MCCDYVSIIAKIKNQIRINRYSVIALLAISLSMVSDLRAQYYNENNSEIEVISKGSNTVPVKGDGFSLTSYRIEFIRQFQPKNSADTDKPDDNKITRIVLTGEFPGGAFVIWINGVGYYATTGTRQELHLIIAKTESILEDDPEIAVSKIGLTEPRVYLPELFNVPKNLQIPGKKLSKLSDSIEFNYVSCGGTLRSQTPTKCISVEINGLPHLASGNTNHIWYLQIGDKEFPGNYDYYTIDAKSFQELKDGEWIVVKPGTEFLGGISLGKLKKSLSGIK